MAEDKEKNIVDELRINDSRLDIEMLEQPNKYYFWSSYACKAARDRRTQKLKLREMQANKIQEYKKNNVGSRLTEKQLDAVILKDPEYMSEEMKLIQLEFIEEQLLNARDAFKQRHQVIIELNKMRKEEKFFGKNEYSQMKKDFEERQISKGEDDE